MSVPRHSAVPDFNYVTTDSMLEVLVDRMREAPRIALDTEADSLHHYFEKVCLIQLSLAGRNHIVDPLAKINLTPFFHILALRPLVLHGADYDLRMLRQTFGFRPKGELFDTMLAAQLVGENEVGLASLVKKHFNVTLSKRGQRTDWSKRPLGDEQLHYACNDTRYLEALADILEEQLDRLGRTAWHREACERLVRVTGEEPPPPSDDAWRIKGSGALDPRELRYLQALWKWRENEAMAMDRPPFKVMTNQLLIELARWAVRHPKGRLERGPKLPRNIRGRRFDDLRTALRMARDLPPEQWPAIPKRKRRAGPSGHGVKQLREEAARVAEELKLAPAIVAPRAAIEAIAQKRPQSLEGIMEAGNLMQWQAKLIQPAVERILR